MADGQKVHAADVGLLHHTEAEMRAALTAATTAQDNYASAVAAESEASGAISIADSNGKAFISLTRKILAPYLGEKWSETWAPLGFPNQSLAVPGQQAARLAVLKATKTHLTVNPTRENTNSKINFTAAQAGALATALDTARATFITRQTDTLAKKQVRDAAFIALRDEMTGLLSELGDLLTDDDARWLAFGVPLPGTDHVPEAPEHLVLSVGAPGIINADWADTPRADRYHIEAQIVGVDTDFKRLLTREESDATLTGLPSGKTVRVRILALNSAGPSAASEVVEIKVP